MQVAVVKQATVAGGGEEYGKQVPYARSIP
jgi:hypothetical protein